VPERVPRWRRIPGQPHHCAGFFKEESHEHEAATGLHAARVEIRRVEDVEYLLVERYDRTRHQSPEGATLLGRVHHEDSCQALGIVSENKYQTGSINFPKTTGSFIHNRCKSATTHSNISMSSEIIPAKRAKGGSAGNQSRIHSVGEAPGRSVFVVPIKMASGGILLGTFHSDIKSNGIAARQFEGNDSG
jgi:hypothetical protein